MKTIKAHGGQTLLDIAIQHGGTVEAVWQIMQANDLSLTDTLQTGQRLLVPDAMERKIVDFYAQNNIIPATAEKENSLPDSALIANDSETILVTNNQQYTIISNE